MIEIRELQVGDDDRLRAIFGAVLTDFVSSPPAIQAFLDDPASFATGAARGSGPPS